MEATHTLLTPPVRKVAVPPTLALEVIEKEFPRELHPYWPELQNHTRTWLIGQRLMSPEKAARYADDLRYTDLMAGYYLEAPDEVLTVITDFSAWFFVWDDRHDRDVVHRRPASWVRLCDQLHAATDRPREHVRHTDPVVAAFAQPLTRLNSSLGGGWHKRFARHFHAVIDAYDREFSNRMSNRVPPVDEYIALRRLTFAHWIWTDLLELTAQVELPDTVRKHPAYRRAALASQEFAAWYNDLCSLPKELAGGELHNLGISLIRHEGLTLADTVLEVRRRVQRCIDDFRTAETDVRRLAGQLADGTPQGERLSTAVALCLRNMRNWFASVYWFHHESGRYAVDSWPDPSTPPYITDSGR
ncbi:multidrug MFS transporter [Streptomyces sp. T-3]|nr:multidrug MFS transporter [Streptomyces sp. T-3]